MLDTLKIFEKIKNTSGLKNKQAIISDNKDNKLFIELAKFILDDSIVTNLSKAKINKKIKDTCEADTEISEFSDFLNYLKDDCSGKDSNILSVRGFIEKADSDEVKNILKEIATKSYKIGIGVKGFDPIVKLFDHIHEVQLANEFEKRYPKLYAKFLKDGKSMKAFITQKLDGIRATVICSDDLKMLSRQGNEFSGLEAITNVFVNEKFKGYVFDGELIVDGLDFNKIQSIVMADEHPDKDKVKFKVFDVITVEDYINKVSKLKYIDRRTFLDSINFNSEIVKQVPILMSADIMNMRETIDKAMEIIAIPKGWEGLMINFADAKYECKRSDSIIKVKKFYTTDVKIVGFVEGQGDQAGRLGAFECACDDGTKVNVSGFDDDVSIEVWNNKEKYLGVTIEIKYMSRTENKKGEKSLRHPNFLYFRYDK